LLRYRDIAIGIADGKAEIIIVATGSRSKRDNFPFTVAVASEIWHITEAKEALNKEFEKKN